MINKIRGKITILLDFPISCVFLIPFHVVRATAFSAQTARIASYRRESAAVHSSRLGLVHDKSEVGARNDLDLNI